MEKLLTTPTEELDVKTEEVTEESSNEKEQIETTDSSEKSIEQLQEEIFNKNESIEDLEKSLFDNIEPTNEEQTAQKEIKQEDNTGSNDSNQVVITKPLKYRGNEIWIKTEDEAIELMQKGMDYSLKMNKIKPHRQIVSLIEDNSLSIEDIQALVDAKNGNSSALDYLAKNFGLKQNNNSSFNDDLFGSDEEKEEETYKPTIEQKSPIEEAFSELTNKEPEVAGRVQRLIDKELDPTFVSELLSNVQVFNLFTQLVANGTFEKVLPYAIKTKAINPSLTWIQAYDYATDQVMKNGDIKSREVSEPTEAVKQTKVNKPKPKSIKKSYEEIWNEKQSIEELEKELFGEILF